MASSYHHALSSVNKWKGVVEDYLPIHLWFDASREMYGDFRHRALRHHSQGLIEAERVFGISITTKDGKDVPVRYIGEQHVLEDCGFVPSVQDWFSQIQPLHWMNPTGFFTRLNTFTGSQLTAAIDFVNTHYAGDATAAMNAIAKVQKSGLCVPEKMLEQEKQN